MLFKAGIKSSLYIQKQGNIVALKKKKRVLPVV